MGSTVIIVNKTYYRTKIQERLRDAKNYKILQNTQ